MKDDTEYALLDPFTERELEVLRLMDDGLDNRSISERLFLSRETVKWYVRQIYSKLHVHSRAEALERARALRLLDTISISVTSARLHHLPAATTSFIGREREIALGMQLLTAHRLVTLIGAGGVGKTRLALRLAADAVDFFDGGVWFVRLEAVTDPEQVAAAVAETLALPVPAELAPSRVLAEFFRDKHLLLVLDNFEQVIAAAPEVGNWLAAGANLHVLVTSREALNIYGEQLFALAPLRIPAADLRSAAADEIAHIEAVRLFVDRARSVKPSFSLTDDNASDVAAICTRLDGIPLAIELAAARVKLFSPQTLRERLDNRLGLLTGGAADLPARQRALRAAIDWSYNLLSEKQKTLFAYLGLFVGGWTLDAADAIFTSLIGNLDVVDSLTSLIDKSLIHVADDTADTPRFTMLPTLQEYALERLADSGQLEYARSAHAAYFLRLAEEADKRSRTSEEDRWFDRIANEHDNVRAALDHYHAGEQAAECDLRMTGALAWFWFVRSHFREGRTRTDAVLSRDSDIVPKPIRAKAYNAAGLFAWSAGQHKRAAELHQVALDFYRELNDEPMVAFSLMCVAGQFFSLGDYLRAITLLDEGIAICRQIHDQTQILLLLNNYSAILMATGKLAEAQLVLEEALALAKVQQRTNDIIILVANLSGLAIIRKEWSLARTYAEEGITLAREIGNLWASCGCLSQLFEIEFSAENYTAAGLYADEQLRLSREIGHQPEEIAACLNLSQLAHKQNELQRSAYWAREALSLSVQIEDTRIQLMALGWAGELAAAEGDHTRAARILSTVRTGYQALDAQLLSVVDEAFEKVCADVRAHLAADAFEATWALGAATTLEQALNDALSHFSGGAEVRP